MTSSNSSRSLVGISRTAWARFASEAVERWISLAGEPPGELQEIATHFRAERYRHGLSLADLAEELDFPEERLGVLEQGLLKPSEVPSRTWVRLMRIVEGREDVADRRSAQPVDGGEQAIPVPPRAEAKVSDERLTFDKLHDHEIGVARVKVIGVGGGGSNAVNRMYHSPVIGVTYIAANTDAQHLEKLDIPTRIRIGDRLTRGLGVGGNPEIGQEAAEESREDIYNALARTDMVFIAAGMGGGTGTGAAPVIAEVAKEMGIITIAVVTKPFTFEGRTRVQQAEEGLERIKDVVDTLVVIPNDGLTRLSDQHMTAETAFRIADDVLRQGVESIAELVTVPGEINLDFADIRTVVKDAGPAWMGIGHGKGENRAVDAARAAIASPLLETSIEDATRVLLNVAGGSDLTLQEVQAAADFVAQSVHPEANIIFGMVTTPDLDEEARVTVVATGLPATVEVVTLEDIVEEAEAAAAEEEEEEDGAEPKVELPGFLNRFRRRGG